MQGQLVAGFKYAAHGVETKQASLETGVCIALGKHCQHASAWCCLRHVRVHMRMQVAEAIATEVRKWMHAHPSWHGPKKVTARHA